MRVAGRARRGRAGADADFADGASELPIPVDGALDEDAAWVKGKRWFRNKPGPARDDRREGFDKRAVDDGYVRCRCSGRVRDDVPLGILRRRGRHRREGRAGIVRALADANCAAGAGA